MSRTIVITDAGFEPIKGRLIPFPRHEARQEDFDCLLAWLHPDRDEAGRRYEQIRARLIRVFAARGCTCPEELADETIDRVTAKVRHVAPGYEGDPALFFYGVARNVAHEHMKARRQPPPPLPAPPDDRTAELDCLDDCLARLLPRNRDLLTSYYHGEGRARIEHRRDVASCWGIDMNALRIRVHRIRSAVADCTTACVQNRHRR